LDELRVNNKWPIAREGFPYVFAGGALTLFLLFLGLVPVSIFMGIVCAFFIFFFRDPDRKNETRHKTVLTPADGKILEIRHLKGNDNPLGQPAIKISIFMSVFNVHVNRIPIAGTIKNITYHAGKFFCANLDKASKYNENNKITLETDDSHKIAFIQIAGLIARRISCWVNEIERVETGQRFGLIRFGSRVDVYLPDDSQITAQPRQAVKAGETIIGYLS
jgi:phosphatidylserine decarboxylase